MSNGVQEVGGPNSTDEAVNKISGGGKSRMSCSSQLRPALLRTQRREKEGQTNGNGIGENSGIICAKSNHGVYLNRPSDQCKTSEGVS